MRQIELCRYDVCGQKNTYKFIEPPVENQIAYRSKYFDFCFVTQVKLIVFSEFTLMAGESFLFILLTVACIVAFKLMNEKRSLKKIEDKNKSIKKLIKKCFI